MKRRMETYAVIGVGAFPTTLSMVFLLPLLNLSYIPSPARVGTNPNATHEIDSSISIIFIERGSRLTVVTAELNKSIDFKISRQALLAQYQKRA
jgi:hypothetical protein